MCFDFSSPVKASGASHYPYAEPLQFGFQRPPLRPRIDFRGYLLGSYLDIGPSSPVDFVDDWAPSDDGAEDGHSAAEHVDLEEWLVPALASPVSEADLAQSLTPSPAEPTTSETGTTTADGVVADNNDDTHTQAENGSDDGGASARGVEDNVQEGHTVVGSLEGDGNGDAAASNPTASADASSSSERRPEGEVSGEGRGVDDDGSANEEDRNPAGGSAARRKRGDQPERSQELAAQSDSDDSERPPADVQPTALTPPRKRARRS